MTIIKPYKRKDGTLVKGHYRGDKMNCCKYGKTGENCEKECKYYVPPGNCSHPELVKEAIEEQIIEKGQLPECGHMCC